MTLGKHPQLIYKLIGTKITCSEPTILFSTFNTVCIANGNTLPFAIWMKCCTVDWTEMTFDPPEFLLKHEVVEPGIKFANFGGRGGDIHGFLTTTQHHLSIKGQSYSHASIAVQLELDSDKTIHEINPLSKI